MAGTSSNNGPGPAPRVYPPELKERAVRMVLESSTGVTSASAR